MTHYYITTAPFFLTDRWEWITFTHDDSSYQATVRKALELKAKAWDTSQAITRRNF